MITIEKMKEFGANTEKGLERCMKNESFYIRMLNLALTDTSGPDKLRKAMEEKNVQAAFEAAHALKGVYGNLSLDPLFDPIVKMTEIFRAGSFEGAEPLYEAFSAKYAEFLKLAE